MEKRESGLGEKTERVYTVSLEGMEFHAFHGVLDSERKDGNLFKVDFVGRYSSACASTDELKDTIDYSAVYDLISEIMSGPRCLLETVACEICDSVAAAMPAFTHIGVKVSKRQPPLGGKCEWSAIETEWDRK